MAEHDYRDVLLKAASIVEQGWCQRHLFVYRNGTASDYMPEGEAISNIKSACALGAIRLAAVELTGSLRGVSAIDQRVVEVLPPGFGDVVYWNDVGGRTAHQVAEMLRKAADA